MTNDETAASALTGARPKLGLALGGGGALGIAHIGVIRVLEAHGIVPDIVTGTSIGAIAGAAYVFGKLDEVEAATRKVDWLAMLSLADPRLGQSGLLGGAAIVKEMRKYLGAATFAEADRPFAVVAADLARDAEVTLQSGDVVDAVRASISLPGIFTPVVHGDALLIDGGMKNPVPVSTCYELGAEHVIAVDVTGDYTGQAAAAGITPGAPFKGGVIEVISTAMAMVMKQLARSRFETCPPDVLIVPKIGHVKQYAFSRGAELIAAGEAAARKAWADIEALEQARTEAR